MTKSRFFTLEVGAIPPLEACHPFFCCWRFTECACGGGVQYLGWYDPLKKETNLNAPAIKKWLGVGAQTSKTVGNLLQKAMVIDRKQVMSPAKTKGLAKHAANNATKKED